MPESKIVGQFVSRLSARFGARAAAREAIQRHYYVPYLHELSSREHHGMLLLERDGVVERDLGLGSGELHWHLTEAGRLAFAAWEADRA